MSRIEFVSHAAVAILCVAAAGNIVNRMFFKAAAGHGPDEAALVGKRIQGEFVKPGRKLVVVAMTTHCRYCLDSTPLFRKLAANQVAYSLVFASPEQPDTVRHFLSGQKIQTAAVWQVGLQSIGVRGTPTILVVDGTEVQKAYIGRLSSSREASLLRYLHI